MLDKILPWVFIGIVAFALFKQCTKKNDGSNSGGNSGGRSNKGTAAPQAPVEQPSEPLE